MKRLFVVLLILIIPTLAFALDFSEYDNSQLLELQKELSAEMLSRNMPVSTHITDGFYVCGIDFPPGSYTILVPENDGYSPMYAIMKKVSSSDEDAIIYGYLEKGTSTKITIEEGQVLVLRYMEDAILSKAVLVWE